MATVILWNEINMFTQCRIVLDIKMLSSMKSQNSGGREEWVYFFLSFIKSRVKMGKYVYC